MLGICKGVTKFGDKHLIWCRGKIVSNGEIANMIEFFEPPLPKVAAAVSPSQQEPPQTHTSRVHAVFINHTGHDQVCADLASHF